MKAKDGEERVYESTRSCRIDHKLKIGQELLGINGVNRSNFANLGIQRIFTADEVKFIPSHCSLLFVQYFEFLSRHLYTSRYPSRNYYSGAGLVGSEPLPSGARNLP